MVYRKSENKLEAILDFLIQNFEADFLSQPQNPEFRNNPETFTHVYEISPCGGSFAKPSLL